MVNINKTNKYERNLTE